MGPAEGNKLKHEEDETRISAEVKIYAVSGVLSLSIKMRGSLGTAYLPGDQHLSGGIWAQENNFRVERILSCYY